MRHVARNKLCVEVRIDKEEFPSRGYEHLAHLFEVVENGPSIDSYGERTNFVQSDVLTCLVQKHEQLGCAAISEHAADAEGAPCVRVNQNGSCRVPAFQQHSGSGDP